MFTPETKTIQPVITRADILTPNGMTVSADYRYLYVTDTSVSRGTISARSLLTRVCKATAEFGGGGTRNVTGSPAIYRFNIEPESGLISNKVLLGFARKGVPDGIKVDDRGRIWTVEYEGIVVRSRHGKVLGIFNQEMLLRDNADPSIPMTNFALAGDKVVIQAVDSIKVVQLTENVIDPRRYYYPSS